MDWIQTYGLLGPNPNRSLVLDSNTGEQQIEFEDSGTAQKIAQCYREDAGAFDVWQVPLRACSSNDGLVAAETTGIEIKKRGMLVSLLSFSFSEG